MIHISQARARYVIPAVLAIIEVAGLLSALLGDGFYDSFCWLALAIPLLVIVAAFATKTKSPTVRQ